MSHVGQVSLATILQQFGLRQTEAEASSTIRNGVVRVNGKTVVDPTKTFAIPLLESIECGKHKIVIQRSF